MTPEQILTKAIEKAIANGWAHYDSNDAPALLKAIFASSGVVMDGRYFLSGIIFDHDFAKALWGEALDPMSDQAREIASKYTGGGATGGMKFYDRNGDWESHLKEMVVAPDPIKYLGDHLDD